MAGGSNMPSGIGLERHGKDPVSRRARAEHYSHYAAEFHALAATRPLGTVRDRLAALALQYEALARAVWRGSEQNAAKNSAGKRGVPKRVRAAELAS